MSSPASMLAIDPGDAERIAATVARFLPPSLARWFDARFIRSDRLFDEYVSRLAVDTLRKVRIDEALAEEGTAEEAVIRAGLESRSAVVPVEWMLRRLAARGLLAMREDASGGRRFHVEQALPILDPAEVLLEQRRHDATNVPSYALADVAAEAYPAVLGGTRSGEDLLLGPARLALWSRYFSNDHPLYAVNNRVGAAALVAAPDDGPTTILELGAGLSSATAAALEALAETGRLGGGATYRVTELVPAFLRTAQRRIETQFPQASCLSFAALDMNAPFEPQGVAPGTVSIVYAVNTLHVAHDLAATLGEVRQALRPRGHLVIAECIRPVAGQTLYPEFVFNVLSTFRAPRLHPLYRPNGGFLTPEQWRVALETAGFADVQLLPDIAAIHRVVPTFCVAAITARRAGSARVSSL